MKGLLSRGAAGVAALVLGATAAVAQPVLPGSRLNFSGNVDVVEAFASGVFLDFDPQTVLSTGGNTGSFSGIGFGATGTIVDITAGSGPQAVNPFVTFGDYTFTLEFIPQGTSGQAECALPPAPGQTCTPLQAPSVTVSPFNLENILSGAPDDPLTPGREDLTADVAFSVRGTVFNNATPALVSTYIGSFTAQFVGQSYQEILAQLAAPGVPVLPDVSFSATFVTGQVIPEPSTYVLMATGLLGLVGAARLRRRA